MRKKSRTAPSRPAESTPTDVGAAPRHIAVVGAGIAGITCARTLMQAGHRVTVFEKSRGVGGRMATRRTEFGSFDHGAQYFTVRDERFEEALATASGLVRPWSASTVRVLDENGRVVAASLPARESHWVATPGMNALVRQWSEPLLEAGQLMLQTRVTRIEADKLQPERWQLQTEGPGTQNPVHSGFDAVVLALPSVQAHELLLDSQQADALRESLAGVTVAPCWSLMLAFPQAVQTARTSLGPQWNVARSTHHRIAWLARESSKPGRGPVERWTVQASPAWSQRHLDDGDERVKAKLLRAFAEVTGIRAEPPHAAVHRWLYAQTVKPLGKTHAWDAQSRIGACGDWCLGHRVEDGFVSGLEMALAIC